MKHIKTCAVIALATLLAACGGSNKTAQPENQKTEKKPSVTTSSAPANNPTAAPSCKATTNDEIASLFDRWNDALQTGKPENVVANYAKDSILLPTVSDKVRYSPAEKLDYFVHFMAKSPVGQINERYIQIGCNSALDAGVYTFTYKKTGESVTGRYSYTYKWDGKQWLITSHHSSLMPEKLLAKTTATSEPTTPVAPVAASGASAVATH